LFLGLSVRTFIHCDVWKDSITLWTHIIERRPPFEKAYSGRGAAYLAEGEYDLALVDIEEAIRLEKNSFRAYNKRSLILLHQGQYDLAIADNNRALEVNPQSKEAYNNRGVARVHKGQYDLAIADFSRALEIDPQSPNAYLNRAIVYYKLKQYDKSWRDVREMERIGWTVDQNFYDLLRKTH